MIRYSKAQRPTSLPIQPFVLIPAEKPQTQHLGCLLEQYRNQKSSKCEGSQPSLKFKGKSSQWASPRDSHCPILLEAPLSSDTCSTCTPSPECFNRTWSQGRPSPCTSKSILDASLSSPKPGLVQLQDKTSPYIDFLHPISATNKSSLIEIPTYQDLINLSPEHSPVKTRPRSPHQSDYTHYCPVFSHTPPTLPVTTDTHCPNMQVCFSTAPASQPEEKFPQYRAAPATDSTGFFHSSFTAALSSVPHLSSLSSLLSLAASGLHPYQILDSAGLSGKENQSQHSEGLILSDRPPTDFCLSPDTSYESMSLSHLQRRGEGL